MPRKLNTSAFPFSYLLGLALCFSILCCNKDDTASKPEVEESEVEWVYTVVEEMPRFPGCEDLEVSDFEKLACSREKMTEFVYDQLIYPTEAIENNIQGEVIIRFVVRSTGSVENPTALKELGFGTGEEGIRIVSSIPDFRPGKQRGEPVDVYFNLPITFEL